MPIATHPRRAALAAGLIGASLLASADAARAGGPRIRLREHFDVSRIHWGEPGVTQTYYGATNTVNLWWEETGRWAFGLAFNPVLSGGYNTVGAEDPAVDVHVRMLQFGLEGKWHFLHERFEDRRSGPFARGGVYANQLLSIQEGRGGNRWGGAWYVALGWEIPLFGERIGVQPDVGFRHAILEQDTQVLTFSPSIAVSLYFVSDWLEGRGWLR